MDMYKTLKERKSKFFHCALVFYAKKHLKKVILFLFGNKKLKILFVFVFMMIPDDCYQHVCVLSQHSSWHTSFADCQDSGYC